MEANEMENKNYPQWKYKLKLKDLHDERHDNGMKFMDYIRGLHKRINAFLLEIKEEDKDLKEQIVDWMQDVFINEDGTIYCVKNDDDWEEIDYELNSLYDIGDQKKMIWFGD